MSAIVQVEENGELRLPAKVHNWKPRTHLQVLVEGEKLVVERIKPPREDESAALWKSRSPKERVAALREWVEALPVRQGQPIPDEALRRENMYD